MNQWMDLEIFKLSEVSQTKRHILCYPLYVDSKNCTNAFIYKPEIELQTWKTSWWLSGDKVGRNKLEDWNWHIYTIK